MDKFQEDTNINKIDDETNDRLNEIDDRVKASYEVYYKQYLKRKLGVVEFGSREDVRNFIEPLLQVNRIIFEKYGPNNDYHEDPEAKEALVWKRKMLSHIIPNSQKIILAMDMNIALATHDELQTIELFRQHVDDLIHRHIGEDVNVGSQFPEAMNVIFK